LLKLVVGNHNIRYTRLACRSSHVDRTNQYDFYKLGKRLEGVCSIDESKPIAEAWFRLIEAQSALSELLEGHPCPLTLSKKKATEAYDCIHRAFGKYCFSENGSGNKEFSAPNDSNVMPYWEWRQIKRVVGEFETVFAEEMREAATYRVPDRGIFSIPKLVDNADQTFAQMILDVLPEKTKLDWKAAGRCLAFNLSTASGFHVARAIEGALEIYYQKFCEKDGTLKSMHEYITQLEKLDREPRPDKKVLAELSYFKTDWRNPLMHPRVVLNDIDSKMLFAKGEVIIMGIALDIHRLVVEDDDFTRRIVAETLAPASTIVVAGTGSAPRKLKQPKVPAGTDG